MNMWVQKDITIYNKIRGFHLITDDIVKSLPEIKNFNIGEATKIDEYVPINTPKIIAKEKPLKISPPKINIDNSASKVVTEVIIVLASVSFIDKSAISLIFNLLYFFKFSLIRS